MLRVITDRQGDSYRLDLHGVLGGEWVPLLEQHWRSIMGALPSAKVTLVLSNVDFIDPDGERLLQRMADDGVEFVVAGCMNRYVIDSLKPGGRARKSQRSAAMRCPEPGSPDSVDTRVLPPLAESERRDLRQADAREARALISSPRHRGHGGEHRASL